MPRHLRRKKSKTESVGFAQKKTRMNAIELNFRLLRGAIDMRDAEISWEAQITGRPRDPMNHRWRNVENLLHYWVENRLLPDRRDMVTELPTIGKRKRKK